MKGKERKRKTDKRAETPSRAQQVSSCNRQHVSIACSPIFFFISFIFFVFYIVIIMLLIVTTKINEKFFEVEKK